MVPGGQRKFQESVLSAGWDMGGPDTPTHLLQDRAVRGLVALSGDHVEENVLTIILQLTFPNLASGDLSPPGPPGTLA